MNGTRKSPKDRESVGWRVGVFGLLLTGVGLFAAPGLVVIGLVIAAIGGIMWGAGMARRD